MKEITSMYPIQLKEKLKNITYQVWLRSQQNENQMLIYEQGDMPIISPPTDMLYIDDSKNYQVHKTEGKTYLSFTPLQEDYQVIIAIQQCSKNYTEEDMEKLYFLFHIALAKEIIRSKDEELNQLMNGIRSVTSSLDLDKLLSKIVNNALKVFPNGEAVFLQLYDDNVRRLVPRASAGFNESIQFFKTKIGESITGKVFKEGKPKVYYTSQDIWKDMSNVSKENAFHIHRAAEYKEAKGVICVPVSIEEQHIGVMTIHLYKEALLTIQPAQLLQGFADQAAIAIKNAELYEKIKRNLNEVTDLSEELKDKNNLLLKSQEMHETLTRLSLHNEGVERIVIELNRLMGTPFFFVDMIDDTYYRKDIPSLFTTQYISSLFANQHEAIYICDDGESKYYLYPIINRAVLLGCIVVPVVKELSQINHVMIEQGATALALELVKKQTLTEIYYKKTHEFFNDILENKDPELIKLRGKDFGFDFSSISFVTIMEIVNMNDLQLLDVRVHQIVSSLKQRLSSFHYLIFGFHNKIILLTAISDVREVQRILSHFDGLLEANRKMCGTILVGVGKAYYGIEKVKKSYEEANKAVSFLFNREKSGVMNYENIGVNRLFLDQSFDEIRRFTDEIFGPLRIDRNNDLEKTLLIYMEMNRNAKISADRLHIHINTLYKRLKKIEKLANLSFEKSEDILKVHLACHLLNHF